MAGLNLLVLTLPSLCAVLFIGLGIVAGLLGYATWRRTVEMRLGRIERRLDRIAEHLGLDAEASPDVKRARELLRVERKIDAT